MGQFLSTVKARVVFGFAIAMAVALAVGGFGLHGLNSLSESLHGMYTGNVGPISDVNATNSSFLQVRLYNWRMLVEKDKSSIQKARSQVATMTGAWKHYYPSGITDAEERGIADKIDGMLPQFSATEDKILAAIDGGNFDAANQLILDAQPLFNSLLDLIQQDVQSNVGQARDVDADAAVQASHLTWIAAGLLAIGVVLSVIVATFVIRSITGPLHRAVNIADEIARGRLDGQITVDANGELGQLLEALKKMSRQLADTVRGILNSSESVTVASGQIAAGNMDLSARTEEQAASLEETAASITQLTETVRQNADNARQANKLAANAREMTDAGSAAVGSMVTTINEISADSAKIAEITGMIEGIAFQTNILALNAAVEAARAGEQGRGFAVVAGEVRALAQRASGAAKEIKDLIGASSTKVQRGAQQASEVNANMDKVSRAIGRVTDIVGEITAASDEQSKGIEQVHQAITQIDEVTQQNAALVEQSAAAAKSLEEQAGQMKSEMQFFRLGRGALPSTRQSQVPAVRKAKSVPSATKTVVKAKPTVAPEASLPAPTAAVGRSDEWESF